MAPKKVMFVAMGSEVEPGRFSLDLQTVDPVIYRPDPTTDAEPSVPVPNAHELHQDIVSGRKAACESKQQRTPRQIQAHIHYVQRSLNLAPGISGQWSRQAQDVLDTWLLKDLKGVQKRNMLALEDKPPAESSCSKAVGNIVESSEALDSQPKDEDANIFEDHHSEALDSQPNDDNMMDEDCVKETTPKDGKAKVSSSSSSSSTSSSSSSDRTKRRKVELQAALTHLKNLQEVHHLEDMGGCLQMIKSAMHNVNAALRL